MKNQKLIRFFHYFALSNIKISNYNKKFLIFLHLNSINIKQFLKRGGDVKQEEKT